MSPRITLYTSQGCQYCRQVRQYLSQKGYAYFEIPLDGNVSATLAVNQLTQGKLLTPLTVINHPQRSEIVVIGFDQKKLDRALKS